MRDIGWPDLRRVLLTSILWAVNRTALWESIIRLRSFPRLPASLPLPIPHHFIGLSGCVAALLNPSSPFWFTMIHQCGDSLTAGRLHECGRPNLLLDPTHLYPHYKCTTSLPDMLLSRGFLWRCLKAAVPTMTLSRRSEAPQCRGPVGYFSMDEAGRRGRGGDAAVPTLIHTFYLIYTQPPYSRRPPYVPRTAVDDYRRVLVAAAATRGIHQPDAGSSYRLEKLI